jgi:hypothetical protein
MGGIQMPFWCNDTAIKSLFRRTTTGQRLATSFSLLFFPSVFFIYFFYLPSASQIKNLSKDHKLLTQRVQNLSETYSKFKILDQENNFLLKQLNSKLKKENVSEFIMNLLQNHGLSCSSIKPIKSTKSDLLKKDYFALSAKGLFKNCVDIFEALQKSGVPVKICKLKMYKWKDNKIKFDLVFRYVSIAS